MPEFEYIDLQVSSFDFNSMTTRTEKVQKKKKEVCDVYHSSLTWSKSEKSMSI